MNFRGPVSEISINGFVYNVHNEIIAPFIPSFDTGARVFNVEEVDVPNEVVDKLIESMYDYNGIGRFVSSPHWDFYKLFYHRYVDRKYAYGWAHRPTYTINLYENREKEYLRVFVACLKKIGGIYKNVKMEADYIVVSKGIVMDSKFIPVLHDIVKSHGQSFDEMFNHIHGDRIDKIEVELFSMKFDCL